MTVPEASMVFVTMWTESRSLNYCKDCLWEAVVFVCGLHVSMAWLDSLESYRRKKSGPSESQTPNFDKFRLTLESCQHVSTICNEYLS